MTLDSTKVRSAVSGAVSLAPTGTAAPADASTPLAAAYKDLGFISDAGVTEARSRSTNEVHAWQGGVLVRTLVTSGTLTYHFVMLETKVETVQLYYGAVVTPGAASGDFVIVPTNTGGRQAFVFDVVDGAELIRTYVPLGEVTDIGDHVYVNSDPVGYDVTITAYPDTVTGGNAHVWATALKS
jgi:hypothetical protein